MQESVLWSRARARVCMCLTDWFFVRKEERVDNSNERGSPTAFGSARSKIVDSNKGKREGPASGKGRWQERGQGDPVEFANRGGAFWDQGNWAGLKCDSLLDSRGLRCQPPAGTVQCNP